MKTIGILEAGLPPTKLRADFGRFDAMMRALLGEDFTYRTFAVHEGSLPASPEACHAYVITGSSAGVYDPLPWIEPLKGFLRAARGRAKLIGICFGHQLMAEAFGGRVEKSVKGWGLGVHRYRLHDEVPGLEGTRERAAISSIASHQDQITVPPSTARVLGGSDFTPFGMLDYGVDGVSLQLHPEFSREFTEALLRLRLARFPDNSETESALRSLATPIDSAAIGSWLRGVVRTERASIA
jgi:GMP synthase-like glutamine amidotransferase